MNLPNKITLSRILLIPVFVAAFYLLSEWLWISAIIFIIAAATDFLDGYFARKNNEITDMGKFLDPIADKVLVISALIVILHKFRFMIEQYSTLINIEFYVTAFAILTIIIIAREIIIGGFRQIAASKNIVLAADNAGKIKTVVQYVTIVLYLFSPLFSSVNMYFLIAFLAMAASAVLSCESAFFYIWQNRKVLADGNDEIEDSDEESADNFAQSKNSEIETAKSNDNSENKNV